MEARSTYDDEACDEGVDGLSHDERGCDGNGGKFCRIKKNEKVISVPHPEA